MEKNKKSKKKICSRGHIFYGSGPCPICWPGQKKTASSSKDVDLYIAKIPRTLQNKLKELRRVIKQVAPKAKESISYGMPFYDYNGRLVYFAAMRGYIGLYIPPPIIANHIKELKPYFTTKSAIHLPLKKLPTALITKLIRARIKHNGQKKYDKKSNLQRYGAYSAVGFTKGSYFR
jgi:uncharacterized protein YdhG (YjbR/CyaY superfamily)